MPTRLSKVTRLVQGLRLVFGFKLQPTMLNIRSGSRRRLLVALADSNGIHPKLTITSAQLCCLNYMSSTYKLTALPSSP